MWKDHVCHSRACLSPVYIPQGYHKTRAFIATQGPLPDTQDDFWRLVWEQKIRSVIMLTKEKEGGKVGHCLSLN